MIEPETDPSVNSGDSTTAREPASDEPAAPPIRTEYDLDAIGEAVDCYQGLDATRVIEAALRHSAIGSIPARQLQVIEDRCHAVLDAARQLRQLAVAELQSPTAANFPTDAPSTGPAPDEAPSTLEFPNV